jgi:hypothetical protein
MKQAAGWDARRRTWAWTTVVACAVCVTGCAATSWLESPAEAELPLDPPAHAYPTAIRASLSDDAESEAAASASPAPSQPPVSSAVHSLSTDQPPTAASPTAPPANEQRADRQPPLRPLAVVPPQYAHPPATTPQTVAAVSPPSIAAQEQASPAALIPTPWPLSLPRLDSNIAAETRTSPVPLTPTVAPTVASNVSSSAPPAAANATSAATSQSGSATNATDSPEQRQARLDRARTEIIESLESEIRRRNSENPKDEELPRLEQQLRLVYLASGRMDEAVAAVESLDPPQREAYKHLMFGLGVWLSPDEARRLPLRSAKVLHSLRDATGELAAASKLELRNLVFCESVDYYGWYREFPRKEFQPKQEVILYVEIDNFAAEQKGSAGYETELQGSYEIYDSTGQMVASRKLPVDKEVCRNYRRDYFLGYKIYMPENIAPGRYRLELTVEDLKARGRYQGRKLGEGMIEFTIR